MSRPQGSRLGHPGRHLHQQGRRRDARPRPFLLVAGSSPAERSHRRDLPFLLRPAAAAGRRAAGADPAAALRPLFTIYDDDDQISILKGVYKQLGLDDKFMQHRAALSRISHAKSHKQSPEEIARAATDPTATRLAMVYERYEARLRESNALDFDDLLLEAVNLLRARRAHAPAPAIAATNS